jgi:hypothetical protein
MLAWMEARQKKDGLEVPNQRRLQKSAGPDFPQMEAGDELVRQIETSREPRVAVCSYEAAGCQAPGIFVRSKRHVHRGRRNGAFISQGPWRRPNLVAACQLREGSARVRFAGGFRARKPWLPRCSYPCRGESHRSPETSFVKPGCEPRLLNVDPRGP